MIISGDYCRAFTWPIFKILFLLLPLPLFPLIHFFINLFLKEEGEGID